MEQQHPDQQWLEDYVRTAGAVAGTVHRSHPGGLKLSAAHNIPVHVQEIVAWVPEGKGMAGQALMTRQPVSTCNLKDDPSATVRPGARAVDAQAAIALPIPGPTGDIAAVVGVAYADGRDFPLNEVAHLTMLAASILT